MKKNLLVAFILLLGLTPINTFAYDNSENKQIEYIGNGIYVETTIEDADIYCNVYI